MGIALSTTLHCGFARAVERAREALAQQGFGVLTEIDMKATLKAKLGVDMEDYLILGACNPAFAQHAIGIDRQVGLLLPCNVVVRTSTAEAGAVIVEALNPTVMMEITGEPALAQVAGPVTQKLQAAIDTLADG